MPTYTYQCKNCSHTFERISKISDRKIPESEVCPECGVSGEVSIIINARMEIVPEHALGRIRPHRDWQEHLNKIKKNNPGSDFTTW